MLIGNFARAVFPALLLPALCSAQYTGYINGASSLTSFNWSNAELINTFSSGGTGNPFAVAANDATLYLPARYTASPGRAFDVVNGQNAQLLDSIPLGYSAMKAVLTSRGGTAFVVGYYNQGVGGGPGYTPYKIFAIDLATLKITATLLMPLPDSIYDIALSPDDTTLFVSVGCTGGACGSTDGACPLVHGICSFDASTLALKATVEKTGNGYPAVGYLAVSQDSKSLYVNTEIQEFYILNASTLGPVYKNPVNFPYSPSGPALVSPVGHYAVVLTSNAQNGTSAYTLDTATNRIVSEFFVSAPLDGGLASVPAGAAFAPSGNSFWMLLGCTTPPACSGFGPTGGVAEGVAFPSGQLIGTVSVPTDSVSIAFPNLAAK